GVPFALGGGLAAWVRGGPKTEHDIDFVVKPEDAERAQAALAEAGFRPERPVEDWLLKAYDGDLLVDLIFTPASGDVDDEFLARADQLEVAAVKMPVASLEDVMVTKPLALTEQEPTFRGSTTSTPGLRRYSSAASVVVKSTSISHGRPGSYGSTARRSPSAFRAPSSISSRARSGGIWRAP